MFQFSTSNIGYSSLENNLVLRLEGFLLRVRIVVYTILIVTLTAFPLLCSLAIFFLETSYVLVYIFYSIKYKYAKNWLLLASKINVGLTVIAVSGIAIYLNVKTSDSTDLTNIVSTKLQHIFMVIFAGCFIIEAAIIFISITKAVISALLYYCCRSRFSKIGGIQQKNQKRFTMIWVRKNDTSLIESPINKKSIFGG